MSAPTTTAPAVQPESVHPSALITFDKAGSLCRVSRWAVDRWAKHGLVLHNGRRVFLKFWSVGRRDFTTREWLVTFLEERAADKRAFFSRKQRPTRREQAAEAHARHEDAMKYLTEQGVS